MKRILCLILTVIMFALVGCGNSSAMTNSVRLSEANTFSEQSMVETLDAFIGSGEDNRRDRTSFGEGEKSAALYIKDRLATAGYVEDETLEIQEFKVEVTQRYGVETQYLYSQNVIATYNPGKEKTVVVGANYDNLFSSIELIGVGGTGSEGIESNATGVCVLLSLAEAFITQSPFTDYTVKFVCFGAGEAGVVGSVRFVSDYLGDVSDVLLAIDLEAISENKINVYSDEVDTSEGRLFIGNGEAFDTEYALLSRAVPLMPQVYAENLDYTHIGLLGDHVPFFEKGVPVVSFFGGEVDGFSYYREESDTIESFKRDCTGYAAAMKDTAQLIYETLTDAGFSAAAASFRTDKYDYSFFVGGYFAYIVYIGIIVALGIALILTVKRLEKKYPYKPVIKRLKIAVFGMEYEQKTDNDIYVDIKQAGGNPFPNNKDDIDPFN